jgi:hypothetical protein
MIICILESWRGAGRAREFPETKRIGAAPNVTVAIRGRFPKRSETGRAGVPETKRIRAVPGLAVGIAERGGGLGR